MSQIVISTHEAHETILCEKQELDEWSEGAHNDNLVEGLVLMPKEYKTRPWDWNKKKWKMRPVLVLVVVFLLCSPTHLEERNLRSFESREEASQVPVSHGSFYVV